MPDPKPTERRKTMGVGVLCGLLAGALWGMVFIVPKLLPAFSPWELAFGRYAAYGLIALAAMLPRLGRIAAKLTRADCLALTRQALAGNLVYYVLLTFAVKLAGVGPASLIIGVLPISVTLLGRRAQDRVPCRKLLLPLALVALGIACINIDLFSAVALAGDGAKALGVTFAVGALACWTWYAIDNARFLQNNPNFSSSEWSALYGLCSGLIAVALAALAYGVFGGRIAHLAAASGGPARDWTYFWCVSALLALGASMIGNNLWNIASRRLPITLSGQMIVFETLFALLYGFIHDHRWPRPLEFCAIALLVSGVAWAVGAHAAQAQEPPH
ncbi:MAG: family transporter [Herbaspirillum sp.]|jgi:drug/metabolite transporter (DMT)-like permease|nr:family transporter [Herbaspirillum sp.]